MHNVQSATPGDGGWTPIGPTGFYRAAAQAHYDDVYRTAGDMAATMAALHDEARRLDAAREHYATMGARADLTGPERSAAHFARQRASAARAGQRGAVTTPTSWHVDGVLTEPQPGDIVRINRTPGSGLEWKVIEFAADRNRVQVDLVRGSILGPQWEDWGHVDLVRRARMIGCAPALLIGVIDEACPLVERHAHSEATGEVVMGADCAPGTFTAAEYVVEQSGYDPGLTRLNDAGWPVPVDPAEAAVDAVLAKWQIG